MTGKEIRLKQLFKHSQRTFILPMDHGVTIGPVEGLKDVLPVIKQVNEKVDALVVHKGMANQIVSCLGPKGCELIIHLSASTVLSPDSNRKELVTSVHHALKLGAAAVSIHVNMGNDAEPFMLRDLGKTAEICDTWGIPLMAMMYVRSGSKTDEYNPEAIKHAARVAEELGADIIKVNYTGSIETFREVVDSVKVPVIIAGGPKMSSDSDLLNMVSEAVKAGAKGVAIGRNVFQHKHPGKLADRIREIIDYTG